MKCLVTNQGTAAAETGICNVCFEDKANRAYIREMASQADDIDPNSDFIDCSENDVVGCQIHSDNIGC